VTDAKQKFKTLINCLVAMAASDGILHEKEVDVISVILKNITGLDINKEIICEAYESYQDSNIVSVYDILNSDKNDIGDDMKELIIKATYLIMISDGDIAEQETEKLSEIAALLDVKEAKFVRFIREAAQVS
jgi:uncharacterized tellurite resistance protein B-like protein